MSLLHNPVTAVRAVMSLSHTRSATLVWSPLSSHSLTLLSVSLSSLSHLFSFAVSASPSIFMGARMSGNVARSCACNPRVLTACPSCTSRWRRLTPSAASVSCARTSCELASLPVPCLRDRPPRGASCSTRPWYVAARMAVVAVLLHVLLLPAVGTHDCYNNNCCCCSRCYCCAPSAAPIALSAACCRSVACVHCHRRRCALLFAVALATRRRPRFTALRCVARVPAV